MKTFLVLLRKLPVCLCILFLVTAANAATIRGRLIHSNGYPAGGIAVTVYNANTGRSSPAYTGGDGMYYIYNVPAGPYYLEVWVYPGSPPVVYQVQIGEPYTDLPQVMVP